MTIANKNNLIIDNYLSTGKESEDAIIIEHDIKNIENIEDGKEKREEE